MSEDESVATHVRPSDLTDKNIRGVLPGEILRDKTVQGLHLRCTPTKKAFYLYYRTKGGTERRPKLGDYGSITLDQARQAARKVLTEVGAGKDPGKENKEARDEKTVEDLWTEWRKRKGEKKKSADADEWLWTKKCQALAKKRLSEVTYSTVADLHDSVTKAGAPTSANRSVALLRAMFNFAIAPLGWIEKNPCIGVDFNPEEKRARYATDEEAWAIEQELVKHEAKHPGVVAFIRLLILTGARKGEIARARWSDLQGNRIILKEHKADKNGKPRIIQLSPEALAVIERLPRIEEGTITGIVNPSKLWNTIRTDAKCPDLRIHDLRHSYAAVAITKAGADLKQIQELLGHDRMETTNRYAHLMNEAAATAAASISSVMVKRGQPQLPENATIQ